MDERYQEVCRGYGFRCRGCEDNCCRSRFYHHTHIETAYLLRGFYRLGEDERKRVKAFAERVFDAQSEDAAASPRLMCPANEEGSCLIYPYRPMICRLHGIAHEMHMPGRPVHFGPGCKDFDRARETIAYIPFDRTPFYRRMAELEKAFRAFLGVDQGVRHTVAEMLTNAETIPCKEIL